MNLDKILKVVDRPARYIGNEFNSVHKDLDGINIRFVFALLTFMKSVCHTLA